MYYRLLPAVAVLIVSTAVVATSLAQSTTLSAPSPAEAPATQPSRGQLLDAIAEFQLPPMAYSAPATTRINAALRKLDEPSRDRLTLLVEQFCEIYPQEPETLLLFKLRWRLAYLFPGPATDQFRASARNIRSIAFHSVSTLELFHDRVSTLEKNPGNTAAESVTRLAFSDRLEIFAHNPTIASDFAYLCKRNIDAHPTDADRSTLISKFLACFPDSPAVLQYKVESTIGAPDVEPVKLPFDLPPDAAGKALLLHFWSPSTPTAASQIQDLKPIAEKHKDTLTIVAIPVDVNDEAVKTFCTKHNIPFPQKTGAAFVASQGITLDDLPVTYLLKPSGALAYVRYDTNLDRPLKRLLAP